MRDNTSNKIKQAQCEKEILVMLSNANNDFVENDHLITKLSASKENSQEIEMRLKMSAVTQEKIEKNRANYRPLAVLTTRIYFIVKELYKWDPMYQFSLQWFEEIFIQAIKETVKTDAKNIEKRVRELKEAIMLRSFKEICRSLFVKHKQLFAFLLAIAKQRCEKDLDESLLNLILVEKGPVDENYKEEPNPTPEVISNKIWEKTQELSKHASFTHLKQLVSENGDYFNEVVSTLESKDLFEEESWPKNILNNFKHLQALTFIKLFRPDLFLEYMKRYIELQIGNPFVQNVVVSL